MADPSVLSPSNHPPAGAFTEAARRRMRGGRPPPPPLRARTHLMLRGSQPVPRARGVPGRGKRLLPSSCCGAQLLTHGQEAVQCEPSGGVPCGSLPEGAGLSW